MPRFVEPARVRGLHLDHALHRSDRERSQPRRRGTSRGVHRVWRHAPGAHGTPSGRRWPRSTSNRGPSPRRPYRRAFCTSCPCGAWLPRSSSLARSGAHCDAVLDERHVEDEQPEAVSEKDAWARPGLASGRPTIRGSTYQQRPVEIRRLPTIMMWGVREVARGGPRTRHRRATGGHGMFFAAMCTPPMTRKIPPATKYFPRRMPAPRALRPSMALPIPAGVGRAGDA